MIKNKLYKYLEACLTLLFIYLPINLISYIFRNQKECWLFTERPDDARDNGLVLYKWICENHPEQNVYYAIHKNSSDYNNVKDLGKIIEYGSIKHWWVFMRCAISCSTQWNIGIPNSLCYIFMRNIFPPKCKRVFLQHGIIKDYMPVGRKEKLHADVFVCGAFPEWEYLNDVMGYSNNEVKYLGLARYDRLDSTISKPQILYMPTWRSFNNDVIDFSQTEYYKKITALLGSTKLYDFLTSTETELIFFLHPHIKDKKILFDKFASKYIKILSNNEDDLQKYICSANLLITDYSSIYFDFAYQGKPVLYYHFDYEEYRSGHYKQGYFSYEDDGFGPIIKEENELINALVEISSDSWSMKDIYKERTERFFPIKDKNNCLRHYNVLKELS